jgi:hypothetical protein
MSALKPATERFDDVVVKSSGRQVQQDVLLDLLCESIYLVLTGQACESSQDDETHLV